MYQFIYTCPRINIGYKPMYTNNILIYYIKIHYFSDVLTYVQSSVLSVQYYIIMYFTQVLTITLQDRR